MRHASRSRTRSVLSCLIPHASYPIREDDMILQAHNVEKHFTEGRESVAVLRGIDFAVDRGEIVSLEGPSGSGKTTFLSILGCILTPTSGDVVIDGVAANAKRLTDIRKRSLGFVFQQFNLFPSLTAVENVEYALNVKGIRGAAANPLHVQRVLDVLDSGEGRKEIELLKDEAERAFADVGQPLCIRCDAVDDDVAARRRQDAAEDREEGR